jgi:hypothetical protein
LWHYRRSGSGERRGIGGTAEEAMKEEADDNPNSK